MTSKEEVTALEVIDNAPVVDAEYVDPHGSYAMGRVQVVEILERLTDSKVNALEILTRLEEALLASALLYTPDAKKARESFGVGLSVFCKSPD